MNKETDSSLKEEQDPSLSAHAFMGNGNQLDHSQAQSPSETFLHPIQSIQYGTIRQRKKHQVTPESIGVPKSGEDVQNALSRLQRMSGFESQDYDPLDSDLEQKKDLHMPFKEYYSEEFWKWFICVLIGLTMGVIAFIVNLFVEVLNNFKYDSTQNVIDNQGGFWAPFMVFMSFTMLYSLVAGGLVSFLEPLAAGSGIPELKTYLNGIHIKGLLAMKTLVAKLVGVIFSIAAGLIAGKEGPFVHSGGIVGGGFGGMGSRTLTKLFKGGRQIKFSHEWGGQFRNDADHRDFTAIGTAAGVAVAFAAPIGGLLFTIEEGASFYSTSIFWRGFLATCTGVATLHFLVELKDSTRIFHEARLGIHRDFGLYNDVLANYGNVYYYYFWELPIFMVIGALGGVLGGVFVMLNVQITKMRHVYIPVNKPWRRLTEVILMAVLTGVVFFFAAYFSPCARNPTREILERVNVGDIPEILDESFYQGGGSADQHFLQLWCPRGEHSVYGQLFFVPLAQALRLIIHMGETLIRYEWEFQVGPLIVYFVVAYIFMIWTYGIGAATGLFVPSLSVGACMGRLIGRLIKQIALAVGSKSKISLSSYAIIGASASLGGATRMTLSITVLIMETTGALELIVPIMITVFFAKLVGDKFGYGIYDTHIKIRGAPVLDEYRLDPHQKMIADKLKVSDVAANKIVVLPPVVKVSLLAHTLRKTSHGAFAVTTDINVQPGTVPTAEGSFKLHGVILRTTLLKMIESRIGFFNGRDVTQFPDPSRFIPELQEDRYELLDKLEQIPVKIRAKEEQEQILQGLSVAEMEQCYVELRPFMQKHPYVIHADANLSRAYRIFRTMGLRHLFVVPETPEVRGVVTRKDISEENQKFILGQKISKGLYNFGETQKELLQSQKELPFIPYSPYDADSQPIWINRDQNRSSQGRSYRTDQSGGGSSQQSQGPLAQLIGAKTIKSDVDTV